MSELWDAWCLHNDDTNETHTSDGKARPVGGVTKTRLSRVIRDHVPGLLASKMVSVEGQKVRGWRGWTLLPAEAVPEQEAIEPAAAATQEADASESATVAAQEPAAVESATAVQAPAKAVVESVPAVAQEPEVPEAAPAAQEPEAVESAPAAQAPVEAAPESPVPAQGAEELESMPASKSAERMIAEMIESVRPDRRET